ncbi:nitroreductase family protein [Actinokineospora enzanensis]|uniref:nitroreductase family protein n=1 Tax=Actinokineospora enzanensis TaxID=155975 RepID=UPI00039CF870|nr:nitroreductase family protein [Actinokineospora enzanensis]
MGLAEVLRARRSVRTFAPTELSEDDVHFVLDAAYAADRRMWPATAHGDPGLTLVLAAFAVAGRPTGLYLAEASRGSLVSVPCPPRVPTELRACADAPALILVCGDVDRASTVAESGYGALLVRAGALGHAAWLGALARGLAGFPDGASRPAITSALRAVRPGLRHLFTVAIGHPVTP